jgi:hypothetical protein
VRRRAHRSAAFGRSGALKLTGGGAIERGEHGELSLGLTGAREAAVQNRRRRRSVEARLERGEKRREVGRGAVMSGGGARVNGFNAIEDGGLDEGLRSEIKVGNQGVE